jgi:hypothetical protein
VSCGYEQLWALGLRCGGLWEWGGTRGLVLVRGVQPGSMCECVVRREPGPRSRLTQRPLCPTRPGAFVCYKTHSSQYVALATLKVGTAAAGGEQGECDLEPVLAQLQEGAERGGSRRLEGHRCCRNRVRFAAWLRFPCARERSPPSPPPPPRCCWGVCYAGGQF